MKTTKTQLLTKKLLIPFLLVEIVTVSVGVSSPAHSTSLKIHETTKNAAQSQLISKEVAEHNLLAQTPSPSPTPDADPPPPPPPPPPSPSSCPWWWPWC